MGVMSTLFLILLVLKLFNLVTISWLAVLSPLLISVMLAPIVLVVMLLIRYWNP